MQSPGFPSVGMQLLSALVQFLGITVLTHCISRRLAGESLSSLSDVTDIPWHKVCLLLVLLDSWLFVFSSGILVFGVGLDINHSVCSAAIDLCVAFYATSKILVYLYLIERVHIVWAPVDGRSRFKSPVDIICFVTVSLYAVVIGLMIAGRISVLRSGDDACVIGLKAFSSIPLLSYDLYINIFLTSLFLWPILKNGQPNQKVKRVARRALLASLIALSTSIINIAVLFALNGHELGWICLASCGVDVTFNSYALYWATGLRRRSRHRISTAADDQVSRDLSTVATKNIMAANPSLQLPEAARPAGHASEHHFHLPLPHFSHMSHSPHIPQFPSRPHPTIPHHMGPNSFAGPVFVPSSPQSEVQISANPKLAEKPPSVRILQVLRNLFHDEPEAVSSRALQVTVMTQHVIEHDFGEECGLHTIQGTV